jgi:hypothetical protein
MKRIILFSLIFCCTALANAKTSLCIRFQGYYTGHLLDLSKNDSVPSIPLNTQITKVRFYVSHIALFQDGYCVYRDKSPGHLIDLSDSTKSEIHFNTKKEILFNEVRFLVGIDSATTLKGIEKGDLDPSNEMYWSWQSGYINFKLEGYSPSCSKERPKYEFHYHIGGYHFYENTCFPVSLQSKEESTTKIIELHLDEVLTKEQLQSAAHIQLPGTAASTIAKAFAHCFQIQ